MAHNLFPQPRPKLRVGVLILRRRRPGFDPQWGARIEAQAREGLGRSALDVYLPGQQIVDAATLRRAMEECDSAGCGVYVAIQPTMSDGRMTPVLGRMSRAPVVFWATPEKPTGEMISANSLVGAHTFMANLAQAGHRFDFVYGSPHDPGTIAELERAVYRAHACSVFDGVYAGLVGYHAPGFSDMHADPATLATIGAELGHVGMHEFIDAVEAVPDEAAAADVEEVRRLGLPISDEIPVDELDNVLLLDSRYYLAIRTLMDEQPLQALALRDWPEISATHWPYLALARLASEGYPIAVEGDVDGALACLMAREAGCGVCYVSDWLEHGAHEITLWHTGAAPFQLCEPPGSSRAPQIGRHFNNRKPAVVNATIRAGMPVTLFRFWHMQGEYLFTAIEGETIEPARHLLGTNGLARFDSVDVPEFFIAMVRAGMPHHPIIVEGHAKKHLSAVAEMLGMTRIE